MSGVSSKIVYILVSSIAITHGLWSMPGPERVIAANSDVSERPGEAFIRTVRNSTNSILRIQPSHVSLGKSYTVWPAFFSNTKKVDVPLYDRQLGKVTSETELISFLGMHLGKLLYKRNVYTSKRTENGNNHNIEVSVTFTLLDSNGNDVKAWSSNRVPLKKNEIDVYYIDLELAGSSLKNSSFDVKTKIIVLPENAGSSSNNNSGG